MHLRQQCIKDNELKAEKREKRRNRSLLHLFQIVAHTQQIAQIAFNVLIQTKSQTKGCHNETIPVASFEFDIFIRSLSRSLLI